MILAKVTGKVISNQKTSDLTGAKLLIVTKVDEFQNIIEGTTYVAVDKVGAGKDDIVLLGKCYNNSYKDLSIVAIVDQIQVDN